MKILVIIALIVFVLNIISDAIYIYTKNKCIEALEARNKVLSQLFDKTVALIELEKPVLDRIVLRFQKEDEEDEQ